MRKENNTTPNSFWWKQGFYDSPVEGGVEITAQYWQALLNGQSNGYEIVENEEGYPVLKAPEPPSEKELRAAEIAELKSKLSETRGVVDECIELEVRVRDKYPELFAQRQAWRKRINELENGGD